MPELVKCEVRQPALFGGRPHKPGDIVELEPDEAIYLENVGRVKRLATRTAPRGLVRMGARTRETGTAEETPVARKTESAEEAGPASAAAPARKKKGV